MYSKLDIVKRVELAQAMQVLTLLSGGEDEKFKKFIDGKTADEIIRYANSL